MSRTISRSAGQGRNICVTNKNIQKEEKPAVVFRSGFGRTGGGEAVASLCEDLHQIVCQISASQIQTQDGVR